MEKKKQDNNNNNKITALSVPNNLMVDNMGILVGTLKWSDMVIFCILSIGSNDQMMVTIDSNR